MRLSLSIEETNRLRAKVGLRLIRDGAETLVEDATPSERVLQLQARIVAAEERAEERALHAAATEGPALASSAPEPTLSWLDRMRQKRSATASEPSPAPTREESPKPEHADQLPIRPANDSAPPSLASIGHTPSQAQKSPEVDITKLDPLEAPAEPRRELKRPAQLDYDAKKAVFKPKKIKSAAKTRTRSSEPALVLPVARNEEPAQARVPTKGQAASAQQSAYAAEADPGVATSETPEAKAGDAPAEPGLIVGRTQSLLHALRQNRKTADDNEELRRPARDVVSREETIEAEAEDASSPEETGPGGQTTSTSIAETLRLLQSERPVALSSKQAAKSRREWSQRLAATRLAKQADLESSLDAFKHLPPHERQKAYELHKKELAAQDAQAAKELFQDYTPDVDFERRDEHGNVIDGKQAFKLLSSAFHGAKGEPGRSRGQSGKSKPSQSVRGR